MSRCGCRRRGTPRLRRLPAPAFGDEAPCRRGRGCRRVRRDRPGVRRRSPAVALALFRAAACLVVAAAALLALPAGVSAQAQNEVRSTWALTPSGLSDGDKFRLIFITSTGRGNATSSDIEVYNTFVQARAAAGHMQIQALQLAVPGGGVHRRDRCPRQHGHHRDRGADLLAERQQGRRQLRGLLRRQLGRRGESEECQLGTESTAGS